MSETIRYARIGKEDINFGTGTFEVRLADGRVVTLQQVDLGELLSDATITTRNVTLDSLTVTTLTVSGTATPSGTLRIPEKADPGTPVSGELLINSGGAVPRYADDAATPAIHAIVAEDTTQTLTNKTLTTPTLTTPVLSGTATGTYALGGTPSLAAPLDVSDEDLTSIDELHFTDATANPTTVGRLRRNGANLLWNDGTTAKIIVLLDAVQTLTNKTLTNPTINSGTIASPTITSPTITGNTVGTDALKTATGSATAVAVSTYPAGSVTTTTDVTMNDYSFFPSLTTALTAGSGGTGSGDWQASAVADPSNTVGRVTISATAQNGGGGGATRTQTTTLRWRYVTASDSPELWIAYDETTGMILASWVSDDPTPNGVPGVQVPGCRSIRLTAADLVGLSEVMSQMSAAAAYIQSKGLKLQHQAYRALQLATGDSAPSRWLVEQYAINPTTGRLVKGAIRPSEPAVIPKAVL